MRITYLHGSGHHVHFIAVLPPEFWVGAFGFAGILVTQILFFMQQKKNTDKIQETKQQVSDIHEEVKAPDGNGSTGVAVNRLHAQIAEHIKVSRDEHREFMVELTALAATMGAHMADGHDPIAKLTADAPRRSGGRDDPAPDYPRREEDAGE